MTSFLLSRASSNFPRFKLPLDYSQFHNKVKHTYQDARAASRRRMRSTCSATRAGSARVLVFFAPGCSASVPARRWP